MFKPAVKSELCQISLTGMRSLVLMGLLLQRPRSLEEIRDEFLKMNLIEENTSTDILRIDLNTLRAMGCEISRAGKSTNRKYVIEKTPFSLDISSEEVSILKKVYKKIRDNLDVKTLYEYDCLYFILWKLDDSNHYLWPCIRIYIIPGEVYKNRRAE